MAPQEPNRSARRRRRKKHPDGEGSAEGPPDNDKQDNETLDAIPEEEADCDGLGRKFRKAARKPGQLGQKGNSLFSLWGAWALVSGPRVPQEPTQRQG